MERHGYIGGLSGLEDGKFMLPQLRVESQRRCTRMWACDEMVSTCREQERHPLEQILVYARSVVTSRDTRLFNVTLN
jgi:hypothetical protein